MTPEDLMKPRYKVIADYNKSPYRIGDILEIVYSCQEVWECLRTGKAEEISPQMFPATFKKLEWWEDRLPEDMPEYVKNDFGVWKQDYMANEILYFNQEANGFPIGWLPVNDESFSHYKPATEQEYLNKTK